MIRFFLTAFITFSLIQVEAQKKIDWMSFEEAIIKNEQEPRQIVIDIYTDWCGWCKKMDKATFQQEHIADYVNTNYYAVKFDAEQKEEIIFKGKTYKYVKSTRRGYHELAASITNGRLSFPTVVFLDESLKVIQAIPGFQDAKTFEMIMSYFADDHYKETPWKKYVTNYISPYKERYKPGTDAMPAVNKQN